MGSHNVGESRRVSENQKVLQITFTHMLAAQPELWLREVNTAGGELPWLPVAQALEAVECPGVREEGKVVRRETEGEMGVADLFLFK